MTEAIYVIVGKDPSLVGARRQELLDRLLEPQQRMTALLSVDADEAVIADVLDELRTAPFLADKRVVVIRGADDFISKHREILEKYFEKPAPTGILILTVSSWPANTKLARKLPKVGKLIEIKSPKRWELAGHLIQHAAARHKVRLNRDAAEMLVEMIGEEPARLYGEVEKLVLFARGEPAISVRHVESLTGRSHVYGAFEVIDAMICGNTAQAVTRLRNMFEEDRDAEYSVVGAFAFHVRRMFNAKKMLEKRVSPEVIAKQLRIGFNKSQFFAQLQRIPLSRIAVLLQELAAIDYATKTGQAQTPVAIEQFVLQLASPTTSRPTS
ncbi:MAG: DNA polymerase III subunit delta [Planctomycetes bacterium RBG_13_62_9]|nr:MAG: DNA polymerase III subunit delta [Planctomycetes bacterium RBG_13_62_9]